jgi:citrate lyase subunit beta / citryl-CoA lyase
MSKKNNVRDFKSYFFVPLYSEELFDYRSYARATKEADCVVLDLEDSLAPQFKETGRKLLSTAWAKFHPLNPNIIVRINSDAHLKADLAALGDLPLSAVMVPKVERLEQLTEVRKLLVNHSDIPLIPIFETPLGILHCLKIFENFPGIPSVIFGSEDLSAGLGLLNPTCTNMQYAAQHLVMVCSVFNTAVIGTAGSFMPISLSRREEYNRSLLFSRELGFYGAFAVHPLQVKSINEIFGYKDELPYIKKVIELGAKANAVFSMDSNMFGPPTLRRYKRILDQNS